MEWAPIGCCERKIRYLWLRAAPPACDDIGGASCALRSAGSAGASPGAVDQSGVCRAGGSPPWRRLGPKTCAKWVNIS